MQLLCPNCAKPIPAEDVSLELGIAKCTACNAVFHVLDELHRPAEKPHIGLPRRFTVEDWGPEVTIRWRWFNHSFWFLLCFCLFWDGVVFFVYAAALTALWNGKRGWDVLVPLLFPIFHLAVGLGLAYWLLCLLLNRTRIRISGGELSVRHGPLFWPGNRQFASADVKQLFCKENVAKGKGGYSFTYDVMVLRQDDTRDTLVAGLSEIDQALFVEQEIERHLKIPDRPVPGEVRY